MVLGRKLGGVQGWVLEGVAEAGVEEEADVLEELDAEADVAGDGKALGEIQEGAELAEELFLVVFEAVNGDGFEGGDVEAGGDVGVEAGGGTGVQDAALVGGEGGNGLGVRIIRSLEEVVVATEGAAVGDGDTIVGDFPEGGLLGGDLGVDLSEFGGTAFGVEEEVEEEGRGEGVLAVPAAGGGVVAHAGRVLAEPAEGPDPLEHGRLLHVDAHDHRPVLEIALQALQGIVSPVGDDGDSFQSCLGEL